MANNLSRRTFGAAQCHVCGSLFTKRSPRSLYCGGQCRVVARRKNVNARAAKARAARPRRIHNRQCRRCSSDFKTIEPYTYYCQACLDAAEKSGRSKYHFLSRRVEVIPDRRRCKGCGKNFTPEWVTQKHCDQACKARARRLTPEGLLNNRMSCAIRRGLLRGKEGRSWQDMVDYSVDDLRRHLERQFKKGMSWDNFGKWHIDHRVPLSSFRFTTPDDHEFRAAWALTNLQPMWAVDNIRKHNRIVCLV